MTDREAQPAATHAVAEVWTAATLLRSIAARGDEPAIIQFTADGMHATTCAALAQRAAAVAHDLLRQGLGRAEPVAVWAGNSVDWVAAALGIMAAGGVLFPLDDLLDIASLNVGLRHSGVRRMFASAQHIADAGNELRAAGVATTPLGQWPDTGHAGIDDLPPLAAEDAALLGWTSGTTGTPKSFLLSYRNIGSNVVALAGLDIVGRNDRVLLPLPLHHAYPLIVGMLTPLTIGAVPVLPADLTGPGIAQALRDGAIRTVVGVPRLYEVMLSAIDAQAAARGRALRSAWRLLMRIAVVAQRTTGWRPGRLWFAGIRRRIAPQLRYLVAGGARLELGTAQRLEALGWTVLCGYGLAETAALFTGNPPNDRSLASAGKPLADGAIRITAPETDGTGEIELRGSSITAGYLDDPEANRAGFTEDGWFRTGDRGFVDRQGFLHVTGRSKEILVLSGGKKINPEELEKHYAAAPQIREIAVLEHDGRLVALVRAETAQVHAMGTLNLREGIRVALTERAQDLPAWQRLSGFALTTQPLPTTRLGKLRRFMLPALYRQALAGGVQRQAQPLSGEDQALLADPVAASVWQMLQQRYPEQTLDLDANLSLELNVDSFGWMELSVALQERHGIHLTEADTAGIETIRDLLRRCVAQAGQGGPAEPEPIGPWLTPTAWPLTLLGLLLYAINWLVMRAVFRLRVSGLEHLPRDGAFVIAPNHASYLDPLAIAAALPLARMRRVYWAAYVTLLFGSRPRRLFSRAAHVFPVDERRPDNAIAAAAQVLEAGRIAVWFPEGWRSPDGRLQRFQAGIGEVLLRTNAPAVPTYVHGSFAAWPRNRRLPRPRRICVVFGPAERPDRLRAAGVEGDADERIAAALRQRVVALADTVPG